MIIRSTRCSLVIITIVALGGVTACSNGVPLGPSNAGSAKTNTPATPTPATPTPAAPTPTVAAAVAYTPDLQPIFNTDCVPCHGSRSQAARYSMTSYAAVMLAVTPRSASSPLVIVTQPGGVMYSFFTGDRAAKAAMVKAWVLNGAPQNR
jgi:mono/diheme cytochrome c family protein